MAKSTNGAKENPYLAHLAPSQRYTGTSTPPNIKEPLFGFLPRRVTGEQVKRALVGFDIVYTVNPLLTFFEGERCQPFHEETGVGIVQKDLRVAEETTRFCSDGRVLQSGASLLLISL